MVLFEWECSICTLIRESTFRDCSLAQIWLCWFFLVPFVIKRKEDLQWLIDVYLLWPLLWLISCLVEYLHVVLCWHFDALAISFRFIEELVDTKIIIFKDSTVLHKLNGLWLRQPCWSTLCTFIHHSDLYISSLLLVSHSYSRINWHIVWCYCILVHLLLFNDGFVHGHVSDSSLLHFETIWICPEGFVNVKSIKQSPVDSHILPNSILKRNRIKLNFKFNEILEQFGISNFYNG